MIGFGGTRGIGRRYIADTVNVKNRTHISSYFVAFGAFGMAFGPLMAVCLSTFDSIIELPFGKGLIFNGLTGPGYVMFVAWTLYTIAIYFVFEEKKRNFDRSAESVGELTMLNTQSDNENEEDHDNGELSIDVSGVYFDDDVESNKNASYGATTSTTANKKPISPVKFYQLKEAITGPIVLYVVLASEAVRTPAGAITRHKRIARFVLGLASRRVS